MRNGVKRIERELFGERRSRQGVERVEGSDKRGESTGSLFAGFKGFCNSMLSINTYSTICTCNKRRGGKSIWRRNGVKRELAQILKLINLPNSLT